MAGRPSHWAVFAVVAVGVLMATIDSSIVNVSLPVIARHFGAPLGGVVEWVVIAYLVAIAALLLTSGRIADVLGRHVTWAVGLAVFTVGSALCGAAPSLGALVAFRALQGIGSAGTMAAGPAMLVAAFPPEQRGRALGLNALVVGLGISAGPTLGGLVTDHLGWRWIFYVNVPLGVAGVIASRRVLPRRKAPAGERVDWLGAVLLAVGLGALTASLSFGGELGWTSAPLVATGALAAVGLGGVVLRILRAPEPILDRRLFANRVFTSAAVSLLLAFMATFAVAFFMPFYLEQVRGFPVARVGLLLTPLPLTVAACSPLTGALADRIGTQKLAAGGMLVAATGLALLGRVDQATPVARLVATLVVIGVGQAVFQPPNNSALMGAAPRDRQGVAAGVLATGRVVGQSVSVALAGALFDIFGGTAAANALRAGAATEAAAQAFLRGMHAALGGCALLALTASAVALIRGRDARTPDRGEGAGANTDARTPDRGEGAGANTDARTPDRREGAGPNTDARTPDPGRNGTAGRQSLER
jgi:EmrB/QacA subfamily drug resistance transporter